jgi:hypothetical protein
MSSEHGTKSLSFCRSQSVLVCAIGTFVHSLCVAARTIYRSISDDTSDVIILSLVREGRTQSDLFRSCSFPLGKRGNHCISAGRMLHGTRALCPHRQLVRFGPSYDKIPTHQPYVPGYGTQVDHLSAARDVHVR